MLVFDIESDGLLDDIEKVHCINLIDRTTGKEERYNDAGTGTGSIRDGLERLRKAEQICGHNAIEFDVPALQIVYPDWKPEGEVLDTKVMSRLIWTDLADRDMAAIRKGKLPADFAKTASRGGGSAVGSHSLKPWGIRLGFPKDDFDPADYGHTWKTVPFSQVMDDYCMQDVRVTVKLLELIESKQYDPRALKLEHQVNQIIFRQMRRGWLFDVEAAKELAKRLQIKRLELEEKARAAFAPWYVPDGPVFTPKARNRKLCYEPGAPVQRVKLVTFNPGSRDHIANRFIKLRGWEPREFTPEGKPKVDETTLLSMDTAMVPEAEAIAEYLRVEKRLGQLAEGKEAWLKAVGPDGRIHGQVNTNGAVTGRMTHFKPNVAQADKDHAMRSLWIVPPGYKLVGCDAEGLELRMLGHYMARWDGGAFARAVVEGRKEDGTDAHSINQRIAGLNKRDNAKTLIYALIYGAGDFKLGTVVYDDMVPEKRAAFNSKYALGSEARRRALVRLGKTVRQRMMEGLPALALLTNACREAAAARGYLIGLDGRRLHIRAEHKAVNTLLQSGGAIVMKKALVLLDAGLQLQGLIPGEDYEFVGNIHDEWQIEVKEEHAEKVGRAAAEAIKQAGEAFSLRCPLAGSYAVGRNWAETH